MNPTIALAQVFRTQGASDSEILSFFQAHQQDLPRPIHRQASSGKRGVQRSPHSKLGRVTALVIRRHAQNKVTHTSDVVRAGLPAQTLYNAAAQGYIKAVGGGHFTVIG